MDIYNSFNELAVVSEMDVSIDNMSKFNRIPKCRGYYFGVCANEEFRGGFLDIPHVHAGKGNDKDAGRFLLEDENTGHVKVTDVKRIEKSKINSIVEHLEDHKDICYAEWDAWIEKYNFQDKQNPTELEKFNKRKEDRQRKIG
jgi:hypothetical protein